MRIILFSGLLLVTTIAFAQVRSVYTNLDTLQMRPSEKGNFDKMSACRPCYLEMYDQYGRLAWAGEMFTDCAIGNFIRYSEYGVISVVEHFKENTTGNWNNLWNRGFCHMPDGEWIYFNERGDTAYSEFWEDGAFVSQVPEQPVNEIWGVDFFVNHKKLNVELRLEIIEKLTPEEVSLLKVVPKLKNSAGIGMNLTLTLQVSAIGKRVMEQTLAAADFHKIDVRAMLEEAGITTSDDPYFQLIVSNNGKQLCALKLNVKY